MGTNYSEQIFQSIDTIISQRLNEVSFDKTEICEIISIDEKIINKYLVSNGSLKYEAYSDDENRKYLVGSKVYVRINNGDYGLKKIITGSYTADEIPKNLYTNPFNHLVVSSKYNWITETNKLSAIAHKDKTTDQDAYVSENLTFYYSGLGQFNYIGLEFAATTGFGGTTGEFQIIVDLLDRNEESLLSEAQLGLLTLSSKQLYGNPYYLNGNLKFQHLFNFPVGNFSDLTKVKKVKITLVTKGNFNYVEERNSVIINDLTIFFGFDSSENKMSENKVALVLDNTRSLEYTTANDKKRMSIDWRDLNSGAIYNETLNMQYPKAGKYNIYWLQYSESIGYAKKLETNDGMDIAESGTYWKTVKRTDAADADAYTYTLFPSADWKKEQIKVIIKKVGTNDYIESNGLTFTNKNFRSETGSNQGSKDTLRLSLAEGDDGVYNSYGIDNKLLTSYNLEHSLTVDYIDNTIWNKDLQKVIWKIPAKATMIKNPTDWELDENGSFYILQTNPDAKTIKFKLSDQFGYNKTNNTIYCKIIRYKDKNSGIVTDSYQGSITLQFGLQGTNGTGWSFNIISSQRALLNEEDQNEMTLTATFEDSEGNPIAGNWDDKVKWSWYQTQYASEAQKRYSMSKTTGKTTVITRNDYVDCYAIIQAKLEDWQDKNGNKIDLVAYMPIAAGNPSYYLTGASRVVYNNAGTSPSYDEAPYVLYTSNHTVVNAKDYTYSIISPETNKNKCFTINTTEGNLKPLSLLPTRVPKMALQVYDNENKWASYIQPILVLKNGYQSKLLNEWNGTLTIDKTNNSIFSALMGAGVKNNDNTFTGVLMGTVGKTISGAKTGIYGMQNGELRFAFDERGAAYIGTGDDNKIAFNGLGGTGSGELEINAKKFNLFVAEDSSYKLLSSKPSDWDNSYTKFYVKKDNKYILNTNSTWKNNTYYKLVPELYIGNSGININDKSAWLSFKDKIHFYKDGTATIGGWNITTNTISQSKDGKTTGFQQPGSGAIAIAVAATDDNSWASAPFYVTHAGKLHATGADIEGKFNINNKSTLNGTKVNKINGTTITSTPESIALKAFEQETTINGVTKTLYAHLQLNADNINAKVSKVNDGITETMSWNLTSGSFTVKANGTQVMKVTKDGLTITGNGTFSGTITAQNGNIGGWSIGKNYLQGTWGNNYVKIKVPDNTANTTFLDVKYNGTFPFVVTKTGHLTATDATITGTINAGSIICDDIGFGNSGRTTFKDYSSPSPPYNVGTIWKHKSSSNSYISLDSRDTVISGVEVGLNSQTGTIGFENNDDYASGFINVHYTDSKEHMQIGTGDYIDLMINGSKKLWCKSTGGVLNGTWTTGSSITVTSDINAKNTINPLSDIYSVLFDNFRPVTYKYNDGTSNRLHTGFIAQEVYKALQIAGINSQDFAGLVIPNENTDDKFWTLRYEEFIALNTWQIQKLKTRVTELENEIKEIKQRYEI